MPVYSEVDKMNEQIFNFMKTSLVPVITNLLRVTEQMAEKESEEHGVMFKAIETETTDIKEMKAAIEKLNESISLLTIPIKDLVTAVNESNQLQSEQNKLLTQMEDSLAENTARMGTMNLALAAQAEDPGIASLYKELEKEGRAG